MLLTFDLAGFLLYSGIVALIAAIIVTVWIYNIEGRKSVDGVLYIDESNPEDVKIKLVWETELEDLSGKARIKIERTK